MRRHMWLYLRLLSFLHKYWVCLHILFNQLKGLVVFGVFNSVKKVAERQTEEGIKTFPKIKDTYHRYSLSSDKKSWKSRSRTLHS